MVGEEYTSPHWVVLLRLTICTQKPLAVKKVAPSLDTVPRPALEHGARWRQLKNILPEKPNP